MESLPGDLQELSHLLEKTAKEDNEGDWKRFRLPNGQLARMSYSYKEERGLKYGFRSAKVSLETPRAEKAIIAALVALKGEQVEADRLRYSLIGVETSDKALASEYSSLEEWSQDLREDPRLGKAKAKDWKAAVRMLNDFLTFCYGPLNFSCYYGDSVPGGEAGGHRGVGHGECPAPLSCP